MTAADRVSVRTQFLKTRLGKGPVLASELEAAARAAGLLGSDQRISDAKPFKRAKESLGIRSVRNGFGSAGEWFWVLEKQSTPSAVAEPDPEAASRIPSSWIEGVGHLRQRRPPPDMPAHRWHQFVSDCHSFLNSSENWAERAAELGWDARALFGCHRNYPLMHLGSAGLLWAINGGKLVELHRDWAVIELPVNRSQRIFSRREVAAGKVALPWIEPNDRSTRVDLVEA